MPCPNISGTLALNPLPHSDSNPIIDLMSHLEPTVAVPTSHLNLISTGTTFESSWAEPSDFGNETSSREEEVIQSNSQPRGWTSPEDMPELSTLNQDFDSQFRLPTRTNRGVPPKRYILEDGTSERVKYPIANYATSNHLSEQLKIFVFQVSSIPILDKVEEAAQDKKWVDAIKSEIEALIKKITLGI
jgi:hypothetical protein